MFRNSHKSMKVPFVVYADFECFTERLVEKDQDENTQYTMKYHKHKLLGFCCYIVCSESGLYNSRPIMYTKKTEDEDIGQMFFDSLDKEIKDIYNSIKYRGKNGVYRR